MARSSTRADASSNAVDRPWRHPRETLEVFGHAGARQALERDWQGGKLHHGLLITGARGIGKATLAYALARRLLTGKTGPEADDPENRTVRQIAAGSHPDLLALDGDESAGVTRTISVESVRDLVSFFGLTASNSPGAGGYRIGIIDRADDMNTASANALLKILEEPPRHAVLILVCETPGRLPATIRSRCRRVPIDPLEPADLRLAVEHAGGVIPTGEDEIRDRWISGSVLRALMVSDPAIAKTVHETSRILQGLPTPDQSQLSGFASSFGPREARAAFDIVFELIDLHLADHARQSAGQGDSRRGAALAECMQSLSRLKREADVLNLDRTRTLLAAFRELALCMN
ncbi:MAG: DNA polymerase III subunit delta' [Rhodobiaceae bacterium]|nr:DNA polymerase III subunit delta' [Rhodobiaceae bacterium]MCC0049348.1 DNA polymerase III subunit delta' [Rhodobiaceae bacterium]